MTVTVFLAGGPSNGTRSFVSDAVISISPTFRNSITEHPIESKASISDHVYRQNVLLSIQGVVSNYPVQEYDDNLIEYNGNRVKTAYNLLKELWEKRSLFTVVSEVDVYRNCVLKSFDTDFTYKTSDTLEYRIEVEQIRLVDVEEIEGFVVDPDVLGDDKSTTSGGSAATRGAKKSEAGTIPAVKNFFSTQGDIIDDNRERNAQIDEILEEQGQ